MKRRKFLSVLVLAPACVVAVVAKAPHSQLKRRWACILSRKGHFLGVRRFRDLQVDDLIQVINEDLAVHDDPDVGRVYRVVEGPKPTSDPPTMGECYIVIEDAKRA